MQDVLKVPSNPDGLKEEKLHEVPYICNWYKETPEKRKDLLMLMTRTIMPTTINYRLVFRMDHQCLANVNN
ncbi:hypothetical protein O3M35_007714 [Rhynocoris fuscipes]|uniref:Uncharacterized protein n=1 Tax=Rhynocoris fuscipes TaxID=488301 RepID=A0AAW1DAJ0_9HEMI